MLDARHNEFWMIWSDIFPLVLFCGVATEYYLSDGFYCQNGFYRVLTSLVLFAVVVSRACSLMYHVFHCLSVRTNQSLINLDLIGICQGALGAPYFMARLLKTSDWNDAYFQLYVCWMSVQYCTCIVAFGYLLCVDSQIKCCKGWAMCNLLVLAVIGNAPILAIGVSPSFASNVRVYCLCGPAALGVGYMIYSLHIPEAFLDAGQSDGRVWNSHVIWHNLVTISQLCFCACIMNTSEW